MTEATESVHYNLLARALKQEGVTHIFCAANLDVDAFLQEGVVLITCSNAWKAAFEAEADSHSRTQGMGCLIIDKSKDELECMRRNSEKNVPLICLVLGDQEQETLHLTEFAYFEVCLTNINSVNQGIRDAVSAAMKHRLPVYVLVHTGALNESSDATSDVLTKSRTLALKKKQIVHRGASEGNVGTSVPEDILSESLPLLFGQDLEELKKDLRNDGVAFCIICLEFIKSKHFVVSYEICKGHVFHLMCFEHLSGQYLSGDILCPYDRAALSGPRKTWIFSSGHISDDDSVKNDDDSDLCTVKLDISQGYANIEDQCSRCARPYQVEDGKITLISCSHTFCMICFDDTMITCSVCGGKTEPYNFSNGEYELYNNLTTRTMGTDLEDTNGESVSQVYNRAQEMPGRPLDFRMISDLEDLVRIRQREVPLRYYQNEVNGADDDEEPDEEPTGNEEMAPTGNEEMEDTGTFWDMTFN